MNKEMTSSEIAEKKTWAKIVNPDAGSQVVAVIDIYRTLPSDNEGKKEESPKSFKQEVDPVAFKIAQDFYEKCQTEITATTRRNDLEKIFKTWIQNPEREFSMVLYALAKGMKVVNVFDRGAALEWHKCHSSTINRTKRAMKKPCQTSDGWTSIGTPSQKKEEPIEESYPKPKFDREDVSVPNLPEVEPEILSMTEIVEKIGQIKTEIKGLDTEIESLLAFHREHLREINRVDEIQPKDLGNYLKTFHEQMIIELERVLDSIQAEINSKRELQSRYCDMLKQ